MRTIKTILLILLVSIGYWYLVFFVLDACCTDSSLARIPFEQRPQLSMRDTLLGIIPISFLVTPWGLLLFRIIKRNHFKKVKV